eukprot:1392794-Amorphochlora_amoeboformis.AAC.2
MGGVVRGWDEDFWGRGSLTRDPRVPKRVRLLGPDGVSLVLWFGWEVGGVERGWDGELWGRRTHL